MVGMKPLKVGMKQPLKENTKVNQETKQNLSRVFSHDLSPHDWWLIWGVQWSLGKDE